jgi:antitoxin VapB
MTNAKAKIFWSGRSQAVRLPKEFRFEATEVNIRREGTSVILELPAAGEDEWSWVDRVVGKFSEGALRAVEEAHDEPQDRPDLDKLFK